MDKLKLQILAQTDALFWPRRDGNRAAIEQARDYFHEAGLMLKTGSTQSDRQALHRQLDALEKSGELEIVRAPGAKSPLVKLTPETETELRKTCTLTTFEGAVPLLADIAHARTHADYRYGNWVREVGLTGIPYGKPKAVIMISNFAEWLLPLLARGLVKSNADSQRHVWYAMTDEGEKMAKTVNEDDFKRIPDDEMTDREEYLQMFYAAEKALDSLKPRDERDIGPIPMPCGI